jgi:hypothetical protein
MVNEPVAFVLIYRGGRHSASNRPTKATSLTMITPLVAGIGSLRPATLTMLPSM